MWYCTSENHIPTIANNRVIIRLQSCKQQPSHAHAIANKITSTPNHAGGACWTTSSQAPGLVSFSQAMLLDQVLLPHMLVRLVYSHF
jgi:hypothetical protein